MLLPGESHGRRSLVGCSPWVAKSRTRLSGFTFTSHFHALEKEMATHSSVLAWRIPGTVEPGGLLSIGSHRVGHDWSDLAAATAAFSIVQLSYPYMTTGKTIALTRRTFVGKVMSLLFNMQSRLVIVFLPRSKRFLISWLQSQSAANLEPKKIKSVTVSPSICHEVIGPMPWFLFFECWVLSQLFHSPVSLSSRGSLVPLHVLPSGWCHLHIWGYWYFSWQSWF